MKKILIMTGFALLVLIAGVLVGLGSLAIVGKKLDKESKAFVDVALPAIVAEWDVDEIQKRASPEFDNEVDYDDLEHDLGLLRQLGKLVEYKGSKGEANITLSFQNGCEIAADYTATADFETGSADMQISLIKHGKQWQILDFRINPEEFTERKDVI
jgi:hypothetical protein